MLCRGTTKFIVLLCLLLALASVGGVFAVWFYAASPAAPNSRDAGIFLLEFVWQPEDILPTETPGENYMALLESILNNDKGGLNSKKDTLENAVLQYKLVHCSQNVQGGNLKHLKDLFTEDSEELDFVVLYSGNTEFHVFMFESDDVEQGSVDLTQIKVFMTILVYENGTWLARESQLGYSTLRRLSSGYIAINPTEWVHGYLPTQPH